MARGECPACSARYDAGVRAPMVSVACGHSVCASCAEDLVPGSAAGGGAACPVCAVAVAGFVKNFEALHALRAVAEVGGGGSGGERWREKSVSAGSVVSVPTTPPSAGGSGGRERGEGDGGGGDGEDGEEGEEGEEEEEEVVVVGAGGVVEEDEEDDDEEGEEGPAFDGSVGSPLPDGVVGDGERRSTFASSAASWKVGDGGGGGGGGQQKMVSSTSQRSARPLEADVADSMHVIDRADLRFLRTPASELGSGSSGVVYAGVYGPGPDSRRVAIKCVRAASREAADSDRFRRELQLASRLRDECIVDFVGAAWDEDGEEGCGSGREVDRPPTILLVTELMRGGTLRSALSSLPNGLVGGLEVHSFLAIATDIARGLVYLHKEGYAHRDIKSANILLTEPPTPGGNSFPLTVRAKIADFGLSKSIDKLTGGAAYQQSIMEPGRLEATYAYLAPEAFGGDKTNVIRADDDDDARLQETAKKRDIYALGVLFWEMITGRVPWAGTSLPDVYVRVCVRGDRPTPSLEDSKVPKTLRRLVDRCWNQDAKKRPSASSIVDKLERLTARLHNNTADSGPSSAAAIAAAAAGAVTITGGEPSSASYWSSTTPRAVVEDSARRNGSGAPGDDVNEAAGPSSRRRAPALARQRSEEAPAQGGGGSGTGVSSAAAPASKHRSSVRQTPVSRPPRDAAPPPGDDWLSASAPVTVIPKHLHNSPHLRHHLPHSQQQPNPMSIGAAAAAAPVASKPAAARNIPRSSSSGVMLGSDRLEDRAADGGPASASVSAKNNASAAAGAAAAALVAAGRRQKDTRDSSGRRQSKKTASDGLVFARSPSYGGPVTTSGALAASHGTTGEARGGRPASMARRQVSMEAARANGNGAAARGRAEDFDNDDADADADDTDFGMATELSAGDDIGDETADALVAELTTPEVLSLLSQRSQPTRLATLALAALDSPKHSTNEDVLRAACSHLHRLTVPSGYGAADGRIVTAMEQLTIRKFLKSNGGVAALLGALKRPETRHPTTLAYALLGLGNLTAWDLDANKQFRDSSGVAHVSDCMRHHSGNQGVQEKGSYAIACSAAAYPPKAKVVFLDTGCIDFVVAALEASSRGKKPSEAVVKQACAALGAMCASCPENAAHAAAGGAIEHLIAAFDSFRNASRTEGGKRSEMHLVGTAFMNLMCHQENRRYAGGQGGTSLMLRSMRIFRLDADFVEKCLSTLSEFCLFRANASHIVQMNGVDDIIAAMVRFKTSVPVQRAGCRTLSALMKATGDEARRRIVHASGSEAIVFALERFGATTGVHAAVAVEGCRAIATLCAMESVEEGEILSRRMKKIRTDRALKQTVQAHRGNQAVEEKAREALKNLSSLKSAGGFFSRMRSKKM